MFQISQPLQTCHLNAGRGGLWHERLMSGFSLAISVRAHSEPGHAGEAIHHAAERPLLGLVPWWPERGFALANRFLRSSVGPGRNSDRAVGLCAVQGSRLARGVPRAHGYEDRPRDAGRWQLEQVGAGRSTLTPFEPGGQTAKTPLVAGRDWCEVVLLFYGSKLPMSLDGSNETNSRINLIPCF